MTLQRIPISELDENTDVSPDAVVHVVQDGVSKKAGVGHLVGIGDFATIAELSASRKLADGKYYTASSGFNGEPEMFLYDADSTFAADGALVVTATGMGAGRLVSTRTVFADFAELDADVRAMATGTVLRLNGVGEYEVVSSGEHLTTAGGAKLRVIPTDRGYNVEAFGAPKDGSADALSAFEGARDAAGENSTWYAPAGNYDLSAPFKANVDNQTIGMTGVNLNNSWANERPGINITGCPVIDPDAFGSRTPFFGVLDCYSQDRSRRSFRVFNVGGPAYVSGNTYRGQVAVGNLSIYAEDCGLVASHSHGDDGIIGYSRSASPSSLPSITSGGSGYTDGRWMAPATNVSSSGSGAVLCFDVESGVVTDFFVANGGKGYSSGDTIGFTNAEAINPSQAAMSGGSGFVLTVGDVMDASTWFNENQTDIAANGGWFGGIAGYGKYNYNSLRLYIEAVYSRTDDLVYIDAGTDNSFDKLSLLVNQNVGETTDRTAKLLNMPNAVGTIVQSGRSSNPFSTSTNPLSDLFDLGVRSTALFDAASGSSSPRGNDYRDFTPGVYGSAGATDFAPTYNTQKGRFRDRAGVVDFVVDLDFDSNAYTVNPGNLYVDMSDLVAKIKGNEPNSSISFWPVEVGDLKTFNLSTDTLFIKSYWQNNQDYIRIFQVENTGSAATDDALGTAEMSASTSGYRIVLNGQIEY